MGVITLTKESHKDPRKYGIKYEDAQQTLGAKSWIPENDKLPVIKTSSKITIIGAGFGGISTSLACLKRLHTEDFVIFEKHANFGGTWWANTYPGAASDIPAVWYSLNDELTSNWSTVQPQQFELEEYVFRVVDKYDLRKRAKFQTSVTTIKWDEKNSQWIVFARDLKTGQLTIHTSEIVINCIGGLVFPKQLEAPGLDKFKGDYIHSAIWNHSVDFKQKKVLVVGNGCSANQIIPELLRSHDPKHITQVVRSKHWIMPPVPTFLQNVYKLLSGSWVGLLIVRFIVAAIAEARFPLFKGNGLLTNFVRKINTFQSSHYMKKAAPKKYHDILIPEFKIGCKRIIFDHSYLPSLYDERITLKGDEIAEFKEHSVILKSGEEVEVDIIVACTGYDLTRSMSELEIIGKNNISVEKIWREEGISAYKTTMIKNVPNFFITGGPNSATGHASVISALQLAAIFISKVADKIVNGDEKTVVVTDKAYDAWSKEMETELSKCVYGNSAAGCNSWYSNGKNFTTYAYSQLHFRWAMNHPNYKDLEYVSRAEIEKRK